MYQEPEKQEFYYQLDRSYFWLSGHYDVAHFILQPYIRALKAIEPGRDLKILDAGCGSGNFISRLKGSRADIYGIDYSITALRHCAADYKVPVFISDLERLALADNQFDIITSLEVVEHIKNDESALREYYRVLKPGGVALITVPAFQILWGPHDDWFGHIRRYRKSELIAKFKKAGFDVPVASYFKCSFFLPMLGLRILKKWFRLYEKTKTDYISVPLWLNQVLKFIIEFEVKSGLCKIIPFGTHLIVLVEKPRIK